MQISLKVYGEHARMVSHLIAKNPHNLYERKEKGGLVRIVFTKNEEHEVQILFFVTVDNMELTKNQTNFSSITHYINDRESAVSSIFCSVLRKAVGTALNGKPKDEFKEWVNYSFPLEITFGPLSTKLTNHELAELFEPLGYELTIENGKVLLPKSFAKKSSAKFITLKAKQTIQDCFRHLFVLIPVMDQYKHYYIDEKEVDKLKRYGEGWLSSHPKRNEIIKESLVFSDLIEKSRLIESKPSEEKQAPLTKKKSLNQWRYEKIIETVKKLPHNSRIVDMGAGEGKLTAQLGFISGIEELIAVDPSEREQLKAKKRIEALVDKPDFLLPTFKWGSLFYYDSELEKKDIFILCEVIEHIDENRLGKVFDTIFTKYKPYHVIVTTPNQDYNAVYDMNEAKRHSDHRFEWTQQQFEEWTKYWESHANYKVQIDGIGEYIEGYGYPTQMAIFSQKRGG
ncbi:MULTISPECIES: methyltransferase domain-containing protein [Niallia]|jgi:3' terminal RNA ribose 2'-O-methyltransferase Hen1|uniref:Small RNA 2'-O-methyltransferase n=1 Tax=Niallia circulans TaxID=1397 RepID=A0A268FH42_NIACI|nr:methyltransferase domain-containing protein [Niallia circulans]AYV66644.1 3' terminal RNA ribose 2'-O-methyltransferase Hen1 [Niallia circulans]AYV70533.1 3' terminal RNA ribose 2'-O-methyltransferase Hen1 [Niallia circulans]NRG27716.1 3' terminal RNA ribose 2'-O-methyltransferase Hen1 [Niallia circulans]PAD84681.1 3' terminal RNA ribose 2'-O-methyltransferase Hen1 [Niallia circulans]QJX62532.1 3' terminal RNA ribose 2'-O-methyltransferase Hen1 [Niallia circulans]